MPLEVKRVEHTSALEEIAAEKQYIESCIHRFLEDFSQLPIYYATLQIRNVFKLLGELISTAQPYELAQLLIGVHNGSQN